MTSTDPGNALFSVFCQNEYWAILTGKMRRSGNVGWGFLFWSFPGDQSSWFTNFPKRQLLRTKHFAPHLNGTFIFCYSLYLSLCVFLFLFFILLHFLWYGIKYEHDPSVSFKNIGNKFKSRKKVCALRNATSICTYVSTFQFFLGSCSVKWRCEHHSQAASTGRCCWQY